MKLLATVLSHFLCFLISRTRTEKKDERKRSKQIVCLILNKKYFLIFYFNLFCLSKYPHNVFLSLKFISFIHIECCWHSTAVVKTGWAKPRKRKWKTHQTTMPNTLSWWERQHTLLWDWREVEVTQQGRDTSCFV